MKTYIVAASLVLVVALALSGCGGTAATPTSTSGNQITLTTNPNPPKSGDVEVIVQVKDTNGQPLDGATVIVIGDHTERKGMMMQGNATAQGNGRYAVKANFAMSGKWKMTVQVNKPGSPALAQDLDLEVK